MSGGPKNCKRGCKTWIECGFKRSDDLIHGIYAATHCEVCDCEEYKKFIYQEFVKFLNKQNN